jgi:hypothetical protein
MRLSFHLVSRRFSQISQIDARFASIRNLTTAYTEKKRRTTENSKIGLLSSVISKKQSALDFILLFDNNIFAFSVILCGGKS